MKKVWQKLTNFEFWPMHLFIFPVYLYYFFCAIKHKNICFFSAANPAMPFGGMKAGKSEIINKFPAKLRAKYIYIPSGKYFNEIKKKINADLKYPLIAKPNSGMRGKGVQKIKDEKCLEKYFINNKNETLIEEFIDLPMEFGVFYIKIPRKKAVISSLMQREFLAVKGDGKKSLLQLIRKHKRAKFYEQSLIKEYSEGLEKIIKKDEIFSLGEIGNHCRGTKFIDINNLISEKMTKSFEKITTENFAGFYYGRYDVKAYSIEDLEKGNVKIIEVNGYNSEPAHIYDPRTNIWKAYKDYFWHISKLSEIARYNHEKMGIKYIDLRTCLKEISKTF